MTEKVYFSKSSRETQELGQKLASTLKGDRVIALFGNLGNGKTTFVQGLAKGLGIKGRIISPTFIIVRQHKIKNQKSKIKSTSQNSKFFYHIDLYRIESKNEINDLGLEEIFNEHENIVAIEWAEKFEKLPERRIEIYFGYISDNERKIVVKRYKQKLEFSY